MVARCEHCGRLLTEKDLTCPSCGAPCEELYRRLAREPQPPDPTIQEPDFAEQFARIAMSMLNPWARIRRAARRFFRAVVTVLVLAIIVIVLLFLYHRMQAMPLTALITLPRFF